jgi:hypothetical protein
MWPLWFALLFEWRTPVGCLFVDQVEDGRALVTDGKRITVVTATGRGRFTEGARLCRHSTARLRSHPSPPIPHDATTDRWQPTDDGEADVR